jgi:hypothetical protein
MRKTVMVRQATQVVTLLLILTMSGCVCTDPPEADLLRENRRHLIESIRPALVEALVKAKKPDGSPAYIDAYKNKKVDLLDEIIRGSARVAPTEKDGGLYTPELPPWKE